MNTVTFTDYEDFPVIKVGDWLVEKGFTLAYYDGMKRHSLEPTTKKIGLLLGGPRTFKQVKTLFWGERTEETTKRKFVGLLILSSDAKWTLNVHSKENVAPLCDMAQELSEAFGVDISAGLTEERCWGEVYSDGVCA
jgi:hypothetical protein